VVVVAAFMRVSNELAVGHVLTVDRDARLGRRSHTATSSSVTRSSSRR